MACCARRENVITRLLFKLSVKQLSRMFFIAMFFFIFEHRIIVNAIGAEIAVAQDHILQLLLCRPFLSVAERGKYLDISVLNATSHACNWACAMNAPE